MYEAQNYVENSSTPTDDTFRSKQPVRRPQPNVSARVESNISFLWDRTTIVCTIGCMLWIVANSNTYFHIDLRLPFVLLFVPALFGNLASIPFCWRAIPDDKHIGSLFKPSIIVGTVGWLIFVPFVSWLVSPLLSTSTGFQPGREAIVFFLYLLTGELYFYCIHRGIHAHGRSYRLIHSQHHRIINPHVVNASYQHPVELIVITMGTAWIGPLIVTGHWTTIALWHAAIMVLGNIGHSGGPGIHDQHHRTSHGNYGFLFMDAVVKAMFARSKTNQQVK